MSQVRDHLWIWAHEAGSHTTAEWGVPEPSRMTPVEGAVYLGVSNVILVRYNGRPAPPYHQYALPLRAMREVVWSVVGAGASTNPADRAAVIALRDELPNLTGVMLDDMFGVPADSEQVAALSLAEIRELRGVLRGPGRPLNLWGVTYSHELTRPISEYLSLCDKISLWTSQASQLAHLERHLVALEKLAPSADKVLGCYMWDYEPKQPMSVASMELQCEQGLRWLRNGRISDMIFLATCICDLDLDAVEWTRRWITDVGCQPL
ncbi:MAG: hypothetical protein JXO22_03690 [Phycisphaerae bacterium]|nr:hypothetical protein [Phycisphaerae bacterium]